MINEKKMVETGTHEELIQENGEYNKIYNIFINKGAENMNRSTY